MIGSHALSFGFVLVAAVAAAACGGQGDFPDQSGNEQVKPGVETASQQGAGSVRAVTPAATAASDDTLNTEMPPAAREIVPGELKVPAPQPTGPTVTTQPFGIDGDWSLTGNGGTNPTNNFVGTTDNVALEFRVNNQRALRIEPGTNPNIVGGHSANSVASGALGAVIAGGGSSGLPNRVYDHDGVVGGGLGNVAGQTGSVSDDAYATVCGGFLNAAKHQFSSITGGYSNSTSADYGAVGGGYSNDITGDYGTVAGGYNNAAGPYAALGGGKDNAAGTTYSFIGGGQSNYTTGGSWATIGGGYDNTVSGAYGTVAGGQINNVSGASGTIGGGGGNTVAGDFATVGGGYSNTAGGARSFAAGCDAHANDAGSFVFGGGCDVYPPMTANSGGVGTFVAVAPGGVALWTGVGIGAGLDPNDSSWNVLSDRNQKTEISGVNPREVLEKVASIPVSTWSYKADTRGIRHMGPMAQDFHAAFGLGSSDKTISTVDPDGVALAAIQGLHSMVKDQAVRLDALEKRNADLARDNADMRTRMDKVEQALAARPLHASSSNVNSAWLGLGAIAIGGAFFASRRRRNVA